MVNTDRELLELAAKAAGNGAQWDCEARGMMVLSDNGCDVDTWNPRDDDGDALRLAVKLCLDIGNNNPCDKSLYVSCHRCGIEMCRSPTREIEEFEDENQRGDATRLAIFRAAVEIGKAMA